MLDLIARIGLATGLVALASPLAEAAPPTIDTLVCKRSAKGLVPWADENAPVIADLLTYSSPGLTNDEGSLTIAEGKKNRGVGVTDVKTKKTRVVHSKNKRYDCDYPILDGKPGSAQWAGNDLILAKGSFCDEFDSRPFFINARKATFLAFFKVKDMTPEAMYHVAVIDKQTLAIAVWDHNAAVNAVTLVSAKTGAILKRKDFDQDAVDALPACK